MVAFLAFIGAMMAFGIDAALPAFDELRAGFDLDSRGLSPAITGTAYLVGSALGQLVAGVLADRFGRRSTLIAGAGIYGAGALASALAPSLGVLLVARFVWGLGAAAPTVLRYAYARDLYSGDQMARVVSTFSAVFLIGPILSPVFGELILLVGNWRWIFATGFVLAVITVLWASAFGETLAPEHRRPLQISPMVEALRAVASTRVTGWLLVAQAFFGGAFFIWLGSAQPVLDEVYGRGSQFTLFFGASGIVMAAALLYNRRLIDRFGTRAMVARAGAAYVVVSVLGLAAALASNGVPSVWVWFGWALAANAMTMIMGPMTGALALEPMADKAGTVAAILGVAQLGVGAALAAVVDAQITTTVTPMIGGALVYGGLAVVCTWLALRVRSASTSGASQVRTS